MRGVGGRGGAFDMGSAPPLETSSGSAPGSFLSVVCLSYGFCVLTTFVVNKRIYKRIKKHKICTCRSYAFSCVYIYIQVIRVIQHQHTHHVWLLSRQHFHYITHLIFRGDMWYKFMSIYIPIAATLLSILVRTHINSHSFPVQFVNGTHTHSRLKLIPTHCC